jgi:hypothetical protein
MGALLTQASGLGLDDLPILPPALKGRDTARVSVWVSLTQAAGLGFVSPPLWGSPAHTSRLSPTGFWSATGWDRMGQLERNVR